uniref:Uncharacterized protein n=1 Tax=Nelumbo nucifera TaxID=4432 RepID=A0A822ZLC1_NELNU|nr:TPA_asm: hypothetical protein HUJ06_004212 [Nelumbo nucifera]
MEHSTDHKSNSLIPPKTQKLIKL